MSIKRIDIRVSNKIKEVVLKESIQCVNHLFLKKLRDVDLSTEKGKVNYINVYTTSMYDEDGKVQQDGNFLAFYKVFDFETFNKLNHNFAKRIYVLDFLKSVFKDLCLKYEWDTHPFEASYAACLEVDIVYDGFFKNKLFRSPNKNFYMGLYFNYDINDYSIFEVLYDKNKNELARRKCYHDTGMVFVIEWASWKESNEMFYYKFKGPEKIFECRIGELLEGKQYDLTKSNSKFFK